MAPHLRIALRHWNSRAQARQRRAQRFECRGVSAALHTGRMARAPSPHVRAVRRDAAERLRHPIVIRASRRTSTRRGETEPAAGASGGIKTTPRPPRTMSYAWRPYAPRAPHPSKPSPAHVGILGLVSYPSPTLSVSRRSLTTSITFADCFGPRGSASYGKYEERSAERWMELLRRGRSCHCMKRQMLRAASECHSRSVGL
jgi:hypothetical protein